MPKHGRAHLRCNICGVFSFTINHQLTTLNQSQQPAQPGICARAIAGINGGKAISAPSARQIKLSKILCMVERRAVHKGKQPP
jgi:hypothetical protein